MANINKKNIKFAIRINNFDQKNNMKVSHGKKQHVIVKII